MAEISRNPSPPHQTDAEGVELKHLLETQADDVITDTMFSKSWLITTMNKVVQFVQKSLITQNEQIIVDLTDSSPETDRVSSPKRAKLNTDHNDKTTEVTECREKERGAANSNKYRAANSAAAECTDIPMQKESAVSLKPPVPVMELDGDIESEFSTLWDATVNHRVSTFFSENNLTPILIHIVYNSRFPRLSEMCMGVLANLACNTEVAEKEFSSPHIAWFTCNMLVCDDPQTLMETLRLIETCISNENIQEVWCSVFEDQKVVDTVQFIFESSTNTELLFSLSRLVDLVIDLWSPLIQKFSTIEMTYALSEAHNQIMHISLETAVNIVMILHQLSTADEGVQVLIKLHTTIVDNCSNHILILHEELGPQLAFSDASYRAAVSILLMTVEALKIKLGTILVEEGKDLRTVLVDICQKNGKINNKEKLPNDSKSKANSTVVQTTEDPEQLDLLEKTHLLEHNI